MAETSGAMVRSVAQDKQSAVSLVAAEVRRAILTGQLAPGQSFAVTDLTSQLGVSHIPVREALRQLEAQGLVVLSAAKRPRVSPLDLDDLDSIYRLRMRLEPPLFRQAVQGRTDAWLDELEAHLSVSFNAAATAEEQWSHHYYLHESLVAPATTPWDRRILQQLWTAAERYNHLVYHPQDIPGPDERVNRIDRHRELVEVARAGEVDRAEQVLCEHLDYSLQRMREAVAPLLRAGAQER